MARDTPESPKSQGARKKQESFFSCAHFRLSVGSRAILRLVVFGTDGGGFCFKSLVVLHGFATTFTRAHTRDQYFNASDERMGQRVAAWVFGSAEAWRRKSKK